MKMEKDHLNDKVLDKEKALSVIKTSYLNSYKIPKPVITNRHNISKAKDLWEAMIIRRSLSRKDNPQYQRM